MRRLFGLIAALWCVHASAAISYVSAVVPMNVGLSATVTTSSYTPAAGDTILVHGLAGNVSHPVTAVTGSLGGTFAWQGQDLADLDSDDIRWFVNTNATAGAQTATLTTSAGGTIWATAIVYRGVGGVGTATIKNTAAPGTGAGALTGTSVTCPVNSVLVTLASDSSATTGATITGVGGTNHVAHAGTGGSDYSWTLQEYACTGSPINGAYTVSAGGDNYSVENVVLAPPSTPPPGAGIAVGYSVWTGQTSAATSITSVGGTTQATGSTFVAIVDNRSAAVPTLTDNFGNTWIQAHTVNSYSVATITFYYCINCVGGAGYAVTATWSASASISGIGLVEFENVGAATLDSNPSAFFDQSDTMSTAAPTLVTTAPSELVVSAFGTENSAFDTITDSGVGFSIVVSQGTGMHGPNGAISWALPAGSSTTAAEIFGHSANDYAGAFTLSIKSGAAPPVTAPPTLPVTGLLGIG